METLKTLNFDELSGLSAYPPDRLTREIYHDHPPIVQKDKDSQIVWLETKLRMAIKDAEFFSRQARRYWEETQKLRREKDARDKLVPRSNPWRKVVRVSRRFFNGKGSKNA